MARAGPVLPPVYSTTVSPGEMRPSRSAPSTIARAMRSFIEPVGLRYSSFTQSSASFAGAQRCRRTSGVLPIASRMDAIGRCSVHGQNVAPGVAGHVLADAVIEHALHPAPFAGADDDQVGVVLLGGLDDRLGGVADRTNQLHGEAGGPGALRGALHLRGVLLRTVGGIDAAHAAAGACVGHHPGHAGDQDLRLEGLGQLEGALERSLGRIGLVIANQDRLHAASPARGMATPPSSQLYRRRGGPGSNRREAGPPPARLTALAHTTYVDR